MANPLTDLDQLVVNALIEFSDLTDIVPLENILVWNNDVEIRDEIDLFNGKIYIQPDRCETQTNYSSGSVQFHRRYGIGFGSGGMKLEDIREIEWQIIRAFILLHNGLQADGATTIVDPTPLVIESVGLGATNPERTPIGEESDGWRDVADVLVTAFCGRQLLL